MSMIKCQNCQNNYHQNLRFCPVCGYPNHNRISTDDFESRMYKPIKTFFIIFGIVILLALIIEGIKATIIAPSSEDGLWFYLFELISGKREMNLFGGFAIIWTVFMFILIWAVPVLIIRAIIRSIQKTNKNDREIYDAAHRLQESKLKFEDMKYIGQKIVRCEYCNKQVRFGNGTCPHCGGKLNKPIEIFQKNANIE